jgi:hypothetical protein
MGVPGCWREAGGRLATFAQGYHGPYELEQLCDATQQLHLDLEPYAAWQKRDFEKRHRRWSQGKKSQGS